jgi:transketolase C-terminal domain/subunit
MKIVGVKDKFGISGSPEELLKAFEVDKEAIERAVEEVLLRK